MTDIISEIVDLWSSLNPVAGYTGGHLSTLTTLFKQTTANMDAMRQRIASLRLRLDEIPTQNLRTTADAILTSLRTQIDLSRPSGAGPSGTGMGGVWASADGVFYIVLNITTRSRTGVLARMALQTGSLSDPTSLHAAS